MDIDTLAASLRIFCDQGRVDDLVQHISRRLQSEPNGFKTLQFALSSVLFAKLETSASLYLILNCLVHIEAKQPGDAPSAAVAHLLLELVPSSLPEDVTAPLSNQAVQLFVQCCTLDKARLALKVAQCYQLTWQRLPDQQAMVEYVQQLLVNKATMTPGVGLAMHFKEVQAVLDCEAHILEIVAAGQEALAEKWATVLGHQQQVAYVEQCVAYGRLKAASKAVRGFRLASLFPDVENMYREKTLGRLMEKRQWGVASTFAGVDARLQTMLVKTLAAEGELALAQEWVRQWGLPPDLARPDPQELAAEMARRAATYLQLQLPDNCITFVNTPELVGRADAALRQVQVVGLDVEWKPFTEKGEGQAPASILQVATEEEVFVFDLIALGRDPALDRCLTALMASEAVMKLGLELAGDLRKLAGSYPWMGAFRRVANMVDIRQVWLAAYQEIRGQVVVGATMKGVSLSKLANELLGRPLDKSMQVSDWEARPLSERQLRYAAQDAHVLLLMRRRLLELAPATCPAYFQAASTVFQAGAVQATADEGTTGDAGKDNHSRHDDDDCGGTGDGSSSTPTASTATLSSTTTTATTTTTSGIATTLTAATTTETRAATGTPAGTNTTAYMPTLFTTHQSTKHPFTAAAACTMSPLPSSLGSAAASAHQMQAPSPLPSPSACSPCSQLVSLPNPTQSISTPSPPPQHPTTSDLPSSSSSSVPAAVLNALAVVGLQGALHWLHDAAAQGVSVASPAEAAAALRVRLERAVKSVALVARGRRVVVVARGPHRLALRKAGWPRC